MYFRYHAVIQRRERKREIKGGGEARRGKATPTQRQTRQSPPSYLRTHYSLHQPFTHSLPPIRIKCQVAETCSPSPSLRCASFSISSAVAGF
ncbi:hypothetical protein V8C44DRAFT_335667, partial [Trichoderma aethiopicum]